MGGGALFFSEHTQVTHDLPILQVKNSFHNIYTMSKSIMNTCVSNSLLQTIRVLSQFHRLCSVA